MTYDRIVFVLGTQRSGTTWLSNIFDSCPDVLHYYEPFAPDYGIFPGFPHEFEYLEPPVPELERSLPDRVASLVKLRSRFHDPVRMSESQFRREVRWMRRLARVQQRTRIRRLLFARQFELVHLNRLGQEPPLYFAKQDSPRTVAIKDVRLYFKIALLARAFPRAVFVHVVRHPAAVVHSMLTYMKRGHLVEIRANIDGFGAAVERQPRLGRFRRLIAEHFGRSMAANLAVFWRVTNEVMAEDMWKLGDRHVTLVYEELATNPLESARTLFDRCTIPWCPETESYVGRSSSTRVERQGVLDTNRDSSSYYRNWVAKISDDVRAAVERVCADSSLMKRFSQYYEPS